MASSLQQHGYVNVSKAAATKAVALIYLGGSSDKNSARFADSILGKIKHRHGPHILDGISDSSRTYR
jgi:hypothetical protein